MEGVAELMRPKQTFLNNIPKLSKMYQMLSTWLGHWSDDCFAQSNISNPHHDSPIMTLVKYTKQTLVNNKNNGDSKDKLPKRTLQIGAPPWPSALLTHQTCAATHRANVRKQLRAHFLVLAQGWYATPPNIMAWACRPCVWAAGSSLGSCI